MLHHLFYMNLEVPVDLDTTWWIHIVMFLSKVGVAIFLILSGYGLFKSYQKKHRTDFIYSKLINLLFKYQMVYILFCIYNEIRYPFFDVTHNFGMRIIDFFGFSSIASSITLNASWWFMQAILICYLLFPFFVKYFQSSKFIFPILCIPVLYLLFHPNINTNYAIYYIYIFYIGIVIAKYDLFNRTIDFIYHRRYLCVYLILVVIVFSILRLYLGGVVDSLYAISIILLCAIFICSHKKIAAIFTIFGSYSLEIFLIHSFIISDPFTASIIRMQNSVILSFLLLCLFSLLCGIIVHFYLKILLKLFSKIPFLDKIL